MTYDEFVQHVKKDIIDQYEDLIIEMADPEANDEYRRRIQEVKDLPHGDLPGLFTAWGSAGWCRQDLVGYLLNLLITDRNTPEVHAALCQMDSWDPVMNLDS